MPKRICLECGRAYEGTETRCPDHRTKSRSSTRSWRRLRETILERDGFLCRYCGEVANTVDHVTPITRGGTDAHSNLVAACGSCNREKGNRTLNEWRPNWTEEHELRARLRR